MSIDNHKQHFIEIYEQESDTLFRFCLLRVSDRELAIDIAQETLTRLWHAFFQKKEIINPRAFLFRVARNLIIDWYRRKKSVSLESLSYGDDWEFDPPDEEIAKKMSIDADASRVLSLLDALHPNYKEVIYLRYVEGLSPKGIAEILKLNSNTVSVRLNRGMESLREHMGIEKNNHE